MIPYRAKVFVVLIESWSARTKSYLITVPQEQGMQMLGGLVQTSWAVLPEDWYTCEPLLYTDFRELCSPVELTEVKLNNADTANFHGATRAKAMVEGNVDAVALYWELALDEYEGGRVVSTNPARG